MANTPIEINPKWLKKEPTPPSGRVGFLLHLAYQLVASAQHFLMQRGEQAEQLAGGEWGAVCHAQQVQQRLHAFAGAGQGLVAGAESLFDFLVEFRQPFH